MICATPLFYEEHEITIRFFPLHSAPRIYTFSLKCVEWLEGFFGTCGYMFQVTYNYLPGKLQSASPLALFNDAVLFIIQGIFAFSGCSILPARSLLESDASRVSEEFCHFRGQANMIRRSRDPERSFRASLGEQTRTRPLARGEWELESPEGRLSDSSDSQTNENDCESRFTKLSDMGRYGSARGPH